MCWTLAIRGGAGDDRGHAVAVDPSGAAYVTGRTDSDASTFPDTVGPQLVPGGEIDAFVAKVSDGGTSLAYAGFLGGAGRDVGYGIAVDSNGRAYVSGETASLPTTVGPDLTHDLGTDAFVAKVGAECRGVAATIIGTDGNDVITGTSGNDVIAAYDGNDTVDGGAGNDLVCAGAGTDILIGGTGDDTLDAGAGIDTGSFPGTASVVADPDGRDRLRTRFGHLARHREPHGIVGEGQPASSLEEMETIPPQVMPGTTRFREMRGSTRYLEGMGTTRSSLGRGTTLLRAARGAIRSSAGWGGTFPPGVRVGTR